MKRNSIIQASIFVVLAFGISIPIFSYSPIALKLFMFFMGIGCGVSLSECLMVKRKLKNIVTSCSGFTNLQKIKEDVSNNGY